MKKEEQQLTVQEQLNNLLESREDLFTNGYKPKQKVEISGELFMTVLGVIGEQQKEIDHLLKASEAMNVFLNKMNNTNSFIALEVLKLHCLNIDKKKTHSTESLA